MVRIDDRAYQWLGSFGNITQANITSTQITPTQTIFKFSAGPAEVTATFLSPIEVILVGLFYTNAFADTGYPEVRPRQTIYTFLVYCTGLEFHRWPETSCTGLYGHQRRCVTY